MNLVFGSVILAWLLVDCVLFLVDIDAECRFQSEDNEKTLIISGEMPTPGGEQHRLLPMKAAGAGTPAARSRSQFQSRDK